MRFQKYCIRCGKLFRPSGRYAKICSKCKKPTGWVAKKQNDI